MLGNKIEELTFDKFSSSFSIESSFGKIKDLTASINLLPSSLKSPKFLELPLSFSSSSLLNDLQGCTYSPRLETGIGSQKIDLRQNPSCRGADWVLLWWQSVGIVGNLATVAITGIRVCRDSRGFLKKCNGSDSCEMEVGFPV